MPPSVAELRTAMERRWHGAMAHAGVVASRALSTGNADLDALLGATGIPAGKLTEICGAPSSGKTTLAFGILAACTRRGGLGAYVDCSGNFFAPAAADAGIDLQRLIVVRPLDLGAARRAVDAFVRGSACEAIAFDCSEATGEVLQAHHCARLVAQAENTGTALLVLTGGNAAAVASFASLRLLAHGLAPLWQDGDGGMRLAGCAAHVDIVKARTVAPGKSVAVEATLPAVRDTWPFADGDGCSARPRVDRNFDVA